MLRNVLLAIGVATTFSPSRGLLLHTTLPRVARPCCSRALSMKVYTGGAGTNLLDTMSRALSEVLADDVKLEYAGSGYGGGGGASVGTVRDTKTKTKYFYKSTGQWGLDMLMAEYEADREMYETKTIKVPRPLAVGTSDSNAFVVFEYLDMGGSRGGAVAELMGRQLAQMHRKTTADGRFGWHRDNTIGATPQPNPWNANWADFWSKARLGHMLKLCKRDGATFSQESELRAKVHEILSRHQCQPSLLHGDLWTGNVGSTPEGLPVIFDPATYYGDRECDIAMTSLFGSLPPAFYDAYQKEWPLPPGFEQRKVIYNLYHILNHYVLFGSGYLSQAQRMIGQILKM